jgi:methylthioribose-1-phosphate isomerase
LFKTVDYKENRAIFIDQTKLPAEEVYVECFDYKSVAAAIKNMVVRGAPAIGVAAAFGIALGVKKLESTDFDGFYSEVEKICQVLADTRPTAVNLFWAIDRMKSLIREHKKSGIDQIKQIVEEEAVRIMEEDIAICKKMGDFGEKLIEDGDTVLTHCNAGALATAGYGTALGVIRAAWEKGKKIKVFADETRPFLQGMRLTAWELHKDNIPVRLITDNMAGYFMKKGDVQKIVVGADRIAANGDVANKIGTYTVAVLAREHKIPFYVAAPISTLDMKAKTGEDICIEERDPSEITHLCGKRMAPDGIEIKNPAFDITPHRLVGAIITEKGIVKAPYDKNLEKLIS